MVGSMIACYAKARPNLKIDSRLSQKIRALSYVGAFCVVCLHFAHYIDTSTWINAFVNDAFIRGCFFASVSLFFVFSGMLLVKDFDGSLAWWKMSMLKRMKTLLLPYLFWCVGYGLFLQITGERADFMTLRFWLECLGISPARVLPLYCQMWYVRNLIFLCALSPILIIVVQLLMRHRIGGSLFCSAFVLVSVFDFPLKDQLVMSTLYFVIGIYLGFDSKWLTRKVPNWICVAFVVVLLARGVGRQMWGSPPQPLHWVSFPLAIVSVWRLYDFAVSFSPVNRLLQKPWMVELQNTSFFCFCFHMWIVLRFPPWPSFMDGWVLQPVLQSCAVMGGGYVLYRMMRQFCPRFLILTTGGR